MENNIYKDLVRQSSFGYAFGKIILDDTGKPVDFELLETNQAFQELTGTEHAEVINKKFSEVLPEIISDSFDWVSFFGTVAIKGKSKSTEQFSEKLDKYLKIYSYSPEPYCFALLITDVATTDISDKIAEQKAIRAAKEEAEADNRLKAAFLAAINYELRVPLNHILGFSELIKNNAPDYEIQEFASIINKSGSEFLAVIEDIFELVISEQTSLKFRPESFSGIKIFMEARNLLERLLKDSGKDKDIKLIFNPEQELFTTLFFSDRFKIILVLTNLFKNAIHHTKSGSIELGLCSEDQKSLVFTVKDTGNNSKESRLDDIFSYIKKTKDFNTHFLYREGHVIGLALACKIAQAMQAELREEKDSNGATAFSFSVPVRIINAEPGDPEDTGEVSVPDLQNRTILIVDDDDYAREMLQKMLAATNAALMFAKHGEEAYEVFMKHQHIDLIFMDIMMPVMDGYTATEKIRGIDPDVLIITLTANAFEIDKEKALRAGGNDFIVKPVKSTTLFNTLNKYF